MADSAQNQSRTWGNEPLNEDPNAVRWAREFIGIFEGHKVGGLTVDEGLMVSWFSNSIMCGYDSAKRAAIAPGEHKLLKVRDAVQAMEERIVSLRKQLEAERSKPIYRIIWERFTGFLDALVEHVEGL